jgi:hypothetical protein
MKRIAIAALLLSLALSLLAPAAQQQATPTPIQGTIQAVQPKSRSLAVVTGVGMALRIVHITVPHTARITAGEAFDPLTALKRGDIVRIQNHRSGTELVADRIEKVPSR